MICYILIRWLVLVVANIATCELNEYTDFYCVEEVSAFPAEIIGMIDRFCEK